MNNQSNKLAFQPRYLIAAVILLAVILAFLNAGKFLVRSDPLGETDLIVVLMGGGPDRILEAIDLYHEGYGKKILMVENSQPGFSLLEERSVSIPREAHLWKSVGMQLGIPEEAFVILQGDAQSTRDEAACTSNYLQAHPEIKSIRLVSSRYHTARANRIFERYVNSGHSVTITARPSRYDTFSENAWWKSREDAKHVVDEYIRLLSFYSVDRL
jgi:uncharacterized SAM-binding protein YcdF (DUF218 family)